MPTPSFSIFPFGACHHADFLKQSPPLDAPEYKAFMHDDLSRMRDLGLNTYNLNLAWFDLEIRPGVFDWRRTDAVREICDELGLGIFPWIFAELTPRWLTRDYPETAAIAATGYSGPSHSYGSPLARERLRQYIHAAVERYDDPVRVLAYNVGVESGLFWLEEQDSSEPAARLWDYNPAVLQGFTRWLEAKYGTVERANLIYRDHFASFDEIEAPNSRFIQEQFMLINQVNWIDWRLYMCELVTDYIHFKGDAVREIAPHAVLADQSYVIDPAFNGQDLWRTNVRMDAIGTSSFVSNNRGEHILGSYWHDVFRSSAKGKPYWIWELRCGQNAWGITNWGLPISGNDAGRYTWHSIAHEVKNVQYWNWRPHIGGIEVGGHAMTERDGALTERAERIGSIARALNRDAAFFHDLRLTPAAIAILEPKLPRIVTAGEGDNKLALESQAGAYGLFRVLGHRIDALHEDEVASGALDAYKLLVVPMAYAMESGTAARIDSWVKAGGSVVSWIFCASKDENGYGQFKVPGLGLHQMFGAEEAKLTPVYGPDDQRRTNMSMLFGESISGRPAFTVTSSLADGGRAKAGDVFHGYRYVSSLRPHAGATVVAKDERGEVVATFNRHGVGQALLVGSFPIRESAFAPDAMDALAADLAQLCGIKPPAEVLDRGAAEVEVELLRSGDGRALLVALTPGSAELALRIRVAGRYRQAQDAETGEAVQLEATPDDTIVTLRLAAGDGRGIVLFPGEAAAAGAP